jgi:hypothetical protein
VSALVRWLPKLAVASADDIARYGPNAARVRSVLDFLPTMSFDAQRVGAKAALRARLNETASDADYWYNALDVAGMKTKDANRIPFMAEAWNDMLDASRGNTYLHGSGLQGAAYGEVSSDLIPSNTYRVLTNPLATGRAVDVLAPRYKDTPFLELLTDFASSRVLAQPRDVLAAGRIARSPEEIREIALQLIEDGGMTVEEAYNAARLLA